MRSKLLKQTLFILLYATLIIVISRRLLRPALHITSTYQGENQFGVVQPKHIERFKQPSSLLHTVSNGSSSAYNYRTTEKITLSNEEGNNWISERFEKGGAFVVGRLSMGAELCILSALRNGEDALETCSNLRPHNMSGIYPETPEMLIRFSNIFSSALNSLTATDAMQSFGRDAEKYFLGKMPTVIMNTKAIGPYVFNVPWSKHLKNKTVLIIHGFVPSIKCQMKRSSLLFSNPLVLPTFQAKYVHMPQCLGGRTPHSSYVETLNVVKDMIDQVAQFDVAIVAAGAYAMPLAVHCKTAHNATAVVMGGASQILFGLKGNRWDRDPVISRLYNEHWMYPLEEDTPANADTIEFGGPYWGPPEQRLRKCPVG